MRIELAVLVSLAGCYRPAQDQPCSVRCDPANGAADCPSPLGCFDGLCRASALDTCGAGVVDAQTDGPADAENIGNDGGCETFGTTGPFTYMACPPPPMGSSVTIPNVVDTNACTGAYFHQLNRPTGMVCLVNADTILIDGSGVTATGVEPLILAARTLVITGKIEVSSRGSTFGAGANYNCTEASSTGTGGQGGPGGSADGIGGAGGADVSGANKPAGTAQPFLPTLHGGCPGIDGDNVDVGNKLGTGGASGGLIYLIGTTQIAITGTFDFKAGGSHGNGGSSAGNAGGGGGGSGGAIVFDGGALTITGTVKICADGGGAGGGGGTTTGETGSAGGDGCGVNNGGGGGGGTGALGGSGSGPGLDGGGGSMAGNGGGGGGGGGAAGYIRAYGSITAMDLMNNASGISPPPQ